MRSTGSGLLARVATLVGSLTLLLFVTSTLVLDPQRPARVLGAMVGTEAGRSLAASAISGELHRLDPRLTQAQADRVARRVVDDPRLAAALTGSTGGDGVLTAVLDSVRRVDPAVAAQLDRRLPTGAQRTTAGGRLLPAAVGSGLTRYRDRIEQALRAGLVIALVAAAAALLLGTDRPRVARRLARWCLVASAVQVFLWAGLPRLLDRMHGRWPVVAAAALRAAGSTLVGVFAALFAAGCALLLAGYVGRFVRFPSRARRRTAGTPAAVTAPSAWDHPAARQPPLAAGLANAAGEHAPRHLAPSTYRPLPEGSTRRWDA